VTQNPRSSLLEGVADSELQEIEVTQPSADHFSDYEQYTHDVCPSCQRVMSQREKREQGACNDCRPDFEPSPSSEDR
jgi:uncharacterized CHY-type Zn-finger protein